jgi:hypothetical protein
VLSYLAAGVTAQELLADFPSLTHEDILACLVYAADCDRRVLVTHPRVPDAMPTPLFDQNLSHRLVNRLADLFPGALQVAQIGVDRASDLSVWEYARA